MIEVHLIRPDGTDGEVLEQLKNEEGAQAVRMAQWFNEGTVSPDDIEKMTGEVFEVFAVGPDGSRADGHVGPGNHRLCPPARLLPTQAEASAAVDAATLPAGYKMATRTFVGSVYEPTTPLRLEALPTQFTSEADARTANIALMQHLEQLRAEGYRVAVRKVVTKKASAALNEKHVLAVMYGMVALVFAVIILSSLVKTGG